MHAEYKKPKGVCFFLLVFFGLILSIDIVRDVIDFFGENDGIGFYRNCPYLLLVCLGIGLTVAVAYALVEKLLVKK